MTLLWRTVGQRKESLPTVRTVSNILNRNEYRLRTIVKTKVQNKMAETDIISANAWNINSCADADAETLRISIDTKATLNVGDYSQEGQSRGLTAVGARDHDMRPKEKLIPGGILEPVSGRSFLFFGSND